ncbi:hypothetical protein MAHJHV59_47460 [Mycobacterium avium subsp. hominissuis]
MNLATMVERLLGFGLTRAASMIAESGRMRRDIAPRRILPDSAIIEAALANPTTIEELVALRR